MTAAVIMPYSSGLYCTFFLTYLWLTKKSFSVGLIFSLIIWLLFASLAAAFPVRDIYLSAFVWLVLVTLSIVYAVKKLPINHQLIPAKIVKTPLWLKATLSGAVISAIVLISKLAGPTWGGIFGTFLALTVSTFLVTIKSGGTEFTRLIAKNVLISTTTTIGIYAILNYFLLPAFGIILSTILAYIGLLLISLPLYFGVFEKIKD